MIFNQFNLFNAPIEPSRARNWPSSSGTPVWHTGNTREGIEPIQKGVLARNQLFLERMDGLIPWQKLEERIRPSYRLETAAGPTPCR